MLIKIKKCIICGKEFIPNSGSQKRCKSCCVFKCAYCGKLFSSNYNYKRQYCSLKCWGKWESLHPKGKNYIKRTCEICGKEFYIWPYQIKRVRKFCSMECYAVEQSIRKKDKGNPMFKNGKYAGRVIMGKRILRGYNPNSIHKGPDNGGWKGGITLLKERIRTLPEYKQWRTDIFRRDHFTCVKCGQVGGNLESHHTPKSFSKILAEFLQEYNQFSPFADKDALVRLAINYKPFWDVGGGETLCKKCHKLTDDYLAGKRHPKLKKEHVKRFPKSFNEDVTNLAPFII